MKKKHLKLIVVKAKILLEKKNVNSKVATSDYFFNFSSHPFLKANIFLIYLDNICKRGNI